MGCICSNTSRVVSLRTWSQGELLYAYNTFGMFFLLMVRIAGAFFFPLTFDIHNVASRHFTFYIYSSLGQFSVVSSW